MIVNVDSRAPLYPWAWGLKTRQGRVSVLHRSPGFFRCKTALLWTA